MAYKTIRIEGKKVARIDPQRGLVEIVSRRGTKATADLRELARDPRDDIELVKEQRRSDAA